MRLLILERSSRYKVACVTSERDGEPPEVIDFLQNQPATTAASAKGFAALFKRYANNGRQGLTTENFHHANRQEGIWEFIKGSLRVYCFMDNDEHLVILTHGVVKKRQKAAPGDIDKAVSLKKSYLDAKASGSVTIIGESNSE